jgi:tetratricopeptide (TPR) repeat protein
MLRTLFALLACIPLVAQTPAAPAAGAVTVKEVDTVIPTYPAGAPERNPLFFTGRTYQGAKGYIYPSPMYDTLTEQKADKTYKLVCLENEYIKVCVMPEIGGRIWEAVDKTNGYNFFYKQSVVKPALIGMLGAWISGGVEWNIPHHHRTSSFQPALYKTQVNADGSKTVWVGEMEIRDRMRWAIGLTLRPGSSVLEAKVTALNTTPLSNSLLYFANVAVHTNNDYQIIFPPKTQWVTQHAKREYAGWPMSNSVYNGIDFRKGVDVSWWKNHPSSISMFCVNDEEDFIAGYDHGKQAGTMHVADHHQAPGKKFFTWGTGPSGRMWDNILSDTDGPYLELMVGGWSDNQPDYSWMQPYEAKSLTQYWYPFRGIGGAKGATTEAAVNLEIKDGKAKAGFYTTSARKQVKAVVTIAGKEAWSKVLEMDPAHPLVEEIALPAGTKQDDVKAALLYGGRELVSYTAETLKPQPMPKAVAPPATPDKYKTVEELTLAGQRLEQFHSPALEPDAYYEEALKRDAGDVKANTALGVLYIKRGRYADAEKLLRAAVDRLTYNHTRPKDGESLYYLGLALKLQERYKEAEDALQRAAWTYAWQSPAYFQLAEIASWKGNLEKALTLLDRSLVTNQWNTRALSLKSTILMRLGRGGDARAARQQIAAIDPIDPRGFRNAGELVPTFKAFPDEGLELVVDCLNAGMNLEAALLLDQMPVQSPMVAYYRGWLAQRMGQTPTAKAHFARAAQMGLDFVFPFQGEALPALRTAMEVNPADARPPYLMGLYLYDRQPTEAARLWREALVRDPALAGAHRNLAVALSMDEKTVPQATAELEKALALDPTDALWYYELDRLYEWAQAPIEKRLAIIDKNKEHVRKRDDAAAREVQLRLLAGQDDVAIEIMKNRHFHIWEGGARFSVTDAWTGANIHQGHKKMAAKDYAGALAWYKAAIEYPENLETTRSYRGSRAPEAYYWEGKALAALGRKSEAEKAFRESAAALTGTEDNPSATVDSGAVPLYYRGKSLVELGEKARARQVFEALVKAGQDAVTRTPRRDFFAKFGETQSRQLRQAMGFYVTGLGQLGLGKTADARAAFAKAVHLNRYLTEAKVLLADAGAGI